MDAINQKIMIFSKEKNSKVIPITYNFSYLKITKIVLQSHWINKPDDWGRIFSATTLTFEFHKKDNTIETYPYNLLQFITLYQPMPVIELNFELPSKEMRVHLNSLNFYDTLTINFDIKSEDKVIYEVYYEVTPGIIITEG